MAEIGRLFSTPVGLEMVDRSIDLEALRVAVAGEQARDPAGVVKSNMGGWQTVLDEQIEGRRVLAEVHDSGDMKVTTTLGEADPGDPILALPPRAAGPRVQFEEEDQAEMEKALRDEGFGAAAVARIMSALPARSREN